MIVRALKHLFLPADFESEAHEAYLALVAQARRPWFYREQGVPDMLDGRFDVIVLHLFLLIHRLRKERSEEAAHFIRAISEVFFSDMDRSLRELGSTDTGVGMRVKKMAEAFYGRLQVYEQNFHNTASLKESLVRNLYRSAPIATTQLDQVAEYMLRNAAHLETQSTAVILNGSVTFSD